MNQSSETADQQMEHDEGGTGSWVSVDPEQFVASEAFALHRALSEREAEIVALLRDRDAQAAAHARYRAVHARLMAAQMGSGRRGLRGWLKWKVLRPRQMAVALRLSPLFVPEWYIARHPEAGEGREAAISHYLRFGSYIGADPGPDFDTMAYYTANPDVAEAGWPALAHYLIHGRSEGRLLRWSAPDE